MTLGISDDFRRAYPGAAIGVLGMRGVVNPPSHPALERRRAEVEARVRQRYRGWDRPRLKQLPAFRAYDAYYRAFGKTYHVLPQVESVAMKGKSITRGGALVEAMFMAELDSALLTAGHDLDAIELPVTLTVSSGGETYLGMGGQLATCTRGDMMIADARGVISCVLRGPDARTRITSDTTRALFTTYAVEGIAEGAVRDHLLALEDHVRLVAPGAVTEALEVITAQGRSTSAAPPRRGDRADGDGSDAERGPARREPHG
jgi:DNA/RNA-binding domain of Phe-tRNA-synthetase-like protein